MYRSTLTVLLGLFIQQVHAQTLAMEKDAPLTVGALASIHQSAYHVDEKSQPSLYCCMTTIVFILKVPM